MLEDADASVGAWVGQALPEGVEISFVAPDEQAPGVRSRGPARVSVFLHEIQAVESAMPAAPVRDRTAGSAVTYAELPVRRYRLTYRITPVAEDSTAEHRMLGAIMRRHAAAGVLPDECRRGALREDGDPLALFLAPAGRSAGPAYIRSELGDRLRASITVELVLPVRPELVREPAAPVRSVGLSSTFAPPDPAS